MEMNISYGYSQKNQQCLDDDDGYADVVYLSEGAKVNTLSEKTQEPIRQKPERNDKKDQAQTKERAQRKCTGVNIILAIAIVATLAIAVIAIIVSVLLTSNSNQEIQSLQLEIENLREILTTEAQSEYIINYKYSVMNAYKLPQEITLHDNQPMNGPFT